MAPVSEAPTTEIGTPNKHTNVAGVLPWSTFIDFDEYAPDLQWPRSVEVYDQMQNDSQIKGLLAGTILPLRRFRWMLEPNGARTEVIEHISRDYQIPVKGKDPITKRPRQRNRFSLIKHLPEALRALAYGHYYFEQVGEVGPDGKWHIKKLAPRPPKTIMEINVAKDGGLEGIRQQIGATAPPIGVNKLVAYVWDQEGGNWVGKSMLRACFRNWLIKDRLLRVDATKHERTGLGVPTAEAGPDMSEEQILALDAMMQRWKSGETSGGAVPSGAKIRLIGTEGNVPDTIASARFHDEQMAKAFLMMFAQLGQTETGSYALGQVLNDFFAYYQEGIADWFCDVFNSHMIEDDVDWNFGEEEQAPLLVYDRAAEEDLPIADLAMLIEKGAIKVDDELEAAIRQRYRLPEKPDEPDPPTPPPVPPPPPGQPDELPPVEGDPVAPAAAGRRSRVQAAGETSPSPLSLPARQLRRQPYDHEVAASVDFATMDGTMTMNIDTLVAEVTNRQREQIQQLHDLIIDADGDLLKLTALSADPGAEDVILARMQAMADAGIDLAVGEAERQGVAQAKRPGLDKLENTLVARAKATDALLARSISEAASRKATALTGGALDPRAVAQQVKDYLNGLSDAYLKDQLTGAVAQSMNAGRKAVMAENEARNIYASELLDTNTCANCTAIDGNNYMSVDDAEADYPTGGYSECLGGPRCRGTLVAVYDETEPGHGI